MASRFPFYRGFSSPRSWLLCVAAGHWGGGARCPLGVLAPQWSGYGDYGGAVWPPVNVPPVPPHGAGGLGVAGRLLSPCHIARVGGQR